MSHRATTTFEVVDIGLGLDDLGAQVGVSLHAGGWLGCVEDRDVADRWVADIAWELMQAGARFVAGSVLERRGTTLQVRALDA